MEIVEIGSAGYAIMADSSMPLTRHLVREMTGDVPLIYADPPYGNVLDEAFDRTELSDDSFAAGMVEWTKSWVSMLQPGGAFYCWGGIGKPQFRPFFRYLVEAERRTPLRLANLITWKKKRGYGIQTNYLFTREELAYFVNGDPKKPRTFHVPYLEEKRTYAGYDKDYPAKSDHYRRTNVWSDVTEILRGKLHSCQKAARVVEVPIEVHTEPGEWVVDPFGGSGETGIACMKLGRKFVLIEKDRTVFDQMVERLRDRK